ncbi:3143_t:CDS:2, partial [Racocetra persica]
IMDEQINEQVNEQMNEQINEQMSEPINELAQLPEKFDQLMKRTSTIDDTLIEAYREPEINPRELASNPLENDSVKLSTNEINVAYKKILVKKKRYKILC